MRKVHDSNPRVLPDAESPPKLSHAAAASTDRLRRRQEEDAMAVIKRGCRLGVDGGGQTRQGPGSDEAYTPADLPPADGAFFRPRTRPFTASSFAFSMVALLSVLLLAQPAAAVLVPFENCLKDSYIYNDPKLLQWVPLFVDASFDADYRLQMTMWGNVTGSLYQVTLPPPDSPNWKDPTKLDGKILNVPEPNSDHPKVTTLHRKVNVLTYEPWHEDVNFCDASLANASCPLPPVFDQLALTNRDLLPSVTMSHQFDSSYAFASFSATFIIIYGDSKGTNIGCVSATATPDIGGLKWLLKVAPLVVLIVVGLATTFAAIFSPWGTTDIFHWTTNYGRDTQLLRLVTPGFADCLQYIQFIVLTGGLTLNYPGFYQPIVSQGSWASLMFNESFVSKEAGRPNLVDGIYTTDGNYGLHRLAQIVGMGKVQDIWAGMMVWLLVIIACIFVLVQAGFFVQWIYRHLNNVTEEDLRSKNIPFSLGNVVRIVFNYFLLPIVALSTFQLVVVNDSPAYTVAMAVVTLVLIIGFAGWLLYLIGTTKPRAFLYDDLPTLLLYGPLYNTYSDEAAAFALIPVLLAFIRGIAIGAVQPSGVAQLVMLAICEVVQILTLAAFHPFHSLTWMNAYHTLFSVLRLLTILMMVAFIPSLTVDEGTRGWVGYAILIIHAGVLVLGFFLNALQTIVEVIARMLRLGGSVDDNVVPTAGGGLSRIFGMRELAARRMSRRGAGPPRSGPSRQSQLSSSAMLDSEEASKSGYIMAGGRVRSESAGSMGVLLHHRHRSSSAMDTISFEGPMRNIDSGASSYTPTTPGEAGSFTVLPSPGFAPRYPPNGLPLHAADPYYRPPRARTATLDDPNASPVGRSRGSWPNTGDPSQRRLSLLARPPLDPAEAEAQLERGPTPAPYSQPAISLSPRTDYSTREVDFYYGVRGERLNSDAPGRKLGTGPADPTGPMASAAGWLRTFLGGKSKEKGKGFEVVRSARMPPAMRAGGGEYGDDAAPQGIPVAMGVLRNGPIESDDEDEAQRKKKGSRRTRTNQPGGDDLLDDDGSPREDDSDVEVGRLSNLPPILPDIDSGGSIRLPSRIQSKASRHNADRDVDVPDMTDLPPVPQVPRKSSKRDSGGMPNDHSRNPSFTLSPPSEASGGNQHRDHLEPGPSGASSRLPFTRTGSQKRLSSASSASRTEGSSEFDLHGPPGGQEERPTSYGYVSQGSISHVNRGVDLLGSSAEVVDTKK